MSIIYLVGGILAVIFLFIIGVYNGLIRTKNRAKEAWADIDVQLTRRYSLIPNLVEAVKGYAAHEKDVFFKVTEARTRAMGAKTLKEKGEAENILSGALKTLFAVSENYPQLRASENFLELQKELRDTEDKIQAARRFYNANVRDLNTKMEVFPNSIVANMFKFKKMDLFEAKEGEEREPVEVKF